MSAAAATVPSQLNSPQGPEGLRIALSAGGVGTWELELTGKLSLWLSPELGIFLGIDPAQFDGSVAAALSRLHPPDQVKVLKVFTKALRAGGPIALECRYVAQNGSLGWLLVRGRVGAATDGRALRCVGVAIDISTQKAAEGELLHLNYELERKLANRTAQLQSTTNELETFCYSVSHDLRAPLRSIRGFNEVLLERYASQLDARGQEFLRRACDSSHHMERLIEGVLKLSRVNRTEMLNRTVNLSELACAISECLRASEPERAVDFEITPGLRGWGDERLLRLALEHLFQNAWKFTSKRPHARIEFGLAAGPEPGFFVRDNGAGFDAAYADRLFGLFQRLHERTEFAGTGIGLAMVQRIIRRHGGRVWANGALEQGATFYFSLPGNELT